MMQSPGKKYMDQNKKKINNESTRKCERLHIENMYSNLLTCFIFFLLDR
jgi:hypothetical protein